MCESNRRSKKLTEAQFKVLYYIYAFHKKWGFYPSYRDISNHFGWQTKGAYDHVLCIKKKGYIIEPELLGKKKPARAFIISEKGLKEIKEWEEE